MLAKISAKNQLTLPKAVTQAVGATEYFEVEARAGQIILTPVRIHRSDAVRAKLAALGLAEGDVAEAVAWSRTQALPVHRVAEAEAPYALPGTQGKAVPAKKAAAKKGAAKSVPTPKPRSKA